ncbi:hypothetical protein ACFL2D_00225 [Patescibacteria group bacterium]
MKNHTKRTILKQVKSNTVFLSLSVLILFTWVNISQAKDLPGDLSENGSVGEDDYDILKGAFGITGDGDIDGDGNTTTLDLALLMNYWGDVSPVTYLDVVNEDAEIQTMTQDFSDREPEDIIL